MSTVVPTVERLLRFVSDDQSLQALVAYFGTAGARSFDGSFFETFRGGGDASQIADRITSDDLIAVQTLAVRVPARAAVDLVEGDLGIEVKAELCAIPIAVPIGSPAAAELLADGGPADRAWRLLRTVDGISWVIAGKILARKRPALIPVYDNVVACAYGRPDRVWLALNDRFREADGALPHMLSELGRSAGLSDSVKPLRALDVIVWKRHRLQHLPSRCQGEPQLLEG